MKITFEGASMFEIFDQMKHVLKFDPLVSKPSGPAALSPEAFKALVNKPVDKPVHIPVDRPVAKPVEKKPRTEKQLANDERMRVAALERIAARKAAARGASDKAAPVEEPVEKPMQDAPEAQPFAEPEADPAEIVKLRTQTMEELQAAYANGHHKEVLELLSRFGNGAKSFRELPPESFVPIRQAIDNGALT